MLSGLIALAVVGCDRTWLHLRQELRLRQPRQKQQLFDDIEFLEPDSSRLRQCRSAVRRRAAVDGTRNDIGFRRSRSIPMIFTIFTESLRLISKRPTPKINARTHSKCSSIKRSLVLPSLNKLRIRKLIFRRFPRSGTEKGSNILVLNGKFHDQAAQRKIRIRIRADGMANGSC